MRLDGLFTGIIMVELTRVLVGSYADRLDILTTLGPDGHARASIRATVGMPR